MTVHGYMRVAWEDYRIPAHIWRNLERHGERNDPCWVWVGNKETDPRMAMATRLSGLARSEILAAVPTCGVIQCANPSHTCLTRVENR